MSESRKDDKKNDLPDLDLKETKLNRQLGVDKWKQIIEAENKSPGSGFTLFKGYMGKDAGPDPKKLFEHELERHKPKR